GGSPRSCNLELYRSHRIGPFRRNSRAMKRAQALAAKANTTYLAVTARMRGLNNMMGLVLNAMTRLPSEIPLWIALVTNLSKYAPASSFLNLCRPFFKLF